MRDMDRLGDAALDAHHDPTAHEGGVEPKGRVVDVQVYSQPGVGIFRKIFEQLGDGDARIGFDIAPGRLVAAVDDGDAVGLDAG